MDKSHHMAAVMEVNLTDCHPNTMASRFNAVPVLKTSAAFFFFLRANLVIPPSEMSSNVSTPVLGPTIGTGGSKGTGNTATASATANQPDGSAVNLDDIPPLTLGVLTTRPDKVDALQLVADSIAQQRQTASRSLVFHPLNVAGLAAALGVAYQLSPRRDLGMLLSLLSGVIMTYLLGIRYFSSQYITLAERLNWEWLRKGSGSDETGGDADPEDEDTIIGARFGQEMIGALVLRVEPPSPSEQASSSSPTLRKRNHNRGGNNNSSSSSSSNLKGGHGVIRAWTTKLRFRRRGVGADLLQEAVRVTRERCGRDAAVGFAQAHANSTMVLPELYNGAFRKTERLAARTLDRVLASMDASKRKR